MLQIGISGHIWDKIVSQTTPRKSNANECKFHLVAGKQDYKIALCRLNSPLESKFDVDVLVLFLAFDEKDFQQFEADSVSFLVCIKDRIRAQLTKLVLKSTHCVRFVCPYVDDKVDSAQSLHSVQRLISCCASLKSWMSTNECQMCVWTDTSITDHLTRMIKESMYSILEPKIRRGLVHSGFL
jgi:hypothetical protein